MRLLAAPCLVLVLSSACGDDRGAGGDARSDATPLASFGRACSSDSQCESGACVPHIGNTVCSQTCDADRPCPDDWTCWSGRADEPAVCVSPFWSLCRPCSADADCASVADDDPGTCVDYRGSGTFCGADCERDADCPDGFACEEAASHTGAVSRQCVNKVGMCECNSYISSLGEPTRCAVENEFGRCRGERVCDSKLWSRCDASVPGPDAPNGRDDDCDGDTDEITCLCGDDVCDGACGETLANCPCDCATEGDGICSPCGESPSSTPTDCCKSPGGTTGCGDGFCIGFGCGENPATCPEDCSTPCGNDICEPGENPFNCAEDCKHEVCGNHVCESSDGGPEACPQDCDAYCGDCECEPQRDESVFNCAIDCGYCGDGACSVCATLRENADTCATDCCRPSPEACNGVDDDCDGTTDEADALGCRLFYRDGDGDGLGRWDDARCLCAGESAWTATTLGDCDDGDGAIGAGTEESCNELDDDCDGATDEDFDLGHECVPPGGACVAGLSACDGPDRTSCVNGPPLKKGSVCSALACEDGVITPPGSCDGAGVCVPLPMLACNGFQCDDLGRCMSSCTDDADCRTGYACGADDTCEQTAPGCVTDAQCVDEDWHTSDFCLVVCGHGERDAEPPTGDVDGDGVANEDDTCPETPDPDQRDSDGDGHGDLCDRCAGAGSDERCNGVDDDCDGETDEGFGVGASCDPADPCKLGRRECDAQGATRCAVTGDASIGTPCGPAACAGDALVLASRCDGAGRCNPGATLPCQGFACVVGAGGPQCQNACVDDGDCATDYHCAETPTGGACAPDLAIGSPCGADGQCASGMCIDGRCCATDCTGGCFTCGSDQNPGQCVPVTPGTDPRGACGPCELCDAAGACADVPAGPSPKNACLVDPPCGTTGLCNAGGECAVATVGTSCSAPSCLAGDLSAGTTCDGAGQCRDTTTSACPGDLLCASASACLTRCTTDRDCRVGNYCDAGGLCQDLKAKGQACTADRMCQTGICADGVCCDGRCDGACESCATAGGAGTCKPYGAGEDPEGECDRCGACDGAGACAPHPAGTDPDEDCAARGPCFQSGLCDGNYGCAPVAATVTCGAAACVGSTRIGARLCDGEGSCDDPTISACVAYVCDAAGAACRTSCTNDTHCQNGFFCDGGACRAKAAKGATCGSNGACQTGFCVDGKCCESACGGVCQACNVDTSGTCVSLDGVPDGACDGELVCEAGACKRRDGAACGIDGDCANGHCVAGICCDTACGGACEACGDGSCDAITSAQNPDRCDGTSWCNAAGSCVALAGSTCSAVPGCPDGWICKDATCVAGALGAACTADRQCVSGQCTDGVCCESECAGTCRKCGAGGRCANLPALTEEVGDCPLADQVCNADGVCRKTPGSACLVNSDCATGRCIDNVCCMSDCGGVCEKCAAGTGVCTAVSGQADPGTCASPSICGGAGICLTSTGTPCDADGDCSSNECIMLALNVGFCCSSVCSGPCKSCVSPTFGSCATVISAENGEACGGTKWCDATGACVSKVGSSCNADGDCPAGTWCETASHQCKAAQGNGATCGTNDRACASGQCVDGVCCESRCDGACECCDQAGLEGQCELLPVGSEDVACGGSEVCSAGGECLRDNGGTCDVDGDCASGYCVAGKCCGTACGGLCQACDSGTCTTVTDDTTPLCDVDFACNADGECVLAAGMACSDDRDCASGICSGDNVCCPAGCTGLCDRCEVDGQCYEALDREENNGRCDGIQWCVAGACVDKDNACVDDLECSPEYFCDGGTCAPDLADGSSCVPEDGDNHSGACASGFCSGNTCCESACHGRCEACAVPGFEGECVPAPAYWNPNGSCAADSACNGVDGGCDLLDGRGCASDDQCVSGACVDGICCHAACNGVCEQCKADGSGCEDVADGSDDNATCGGGRECWGGVCLKGAGEACAAGSECASSHCADTTTTAGFVGACCAAACNQACQACDPNDGSCDAVVRADDELCPGGWCDMTGTCRAKTGSPCALDTDCPGGWYCNGSQCEEKLDAGQSCTRPGMCDTGVCADNGVCCTSACDGPCDQCDGGGVCRFEPANAQGQCAEGLACDGRGSCKKAKGSFCGVAEECASGFCADAPGGVCCDEACDGTCERCSGTGHCQAVVASVDDTCGAPFECAGTGQCLLQNGQPCAVDGACASGSCVNGTCCGTDCGPCYLCQGPGYGTCNALPVINGVTLECNGTRMCNGGGQCLPL